jgi:RHS repeat-associated protein
VKTFVLSFIFIIFLSGFLFAQVPNPAIIVAPLNGSVGLDFAGQTLAWCPAGSGGIPSGYHVYLGTSTPPTSEVSNQSGTAYITGSLIPVTTYYWQIVPYNADGSAVNCPIWMFTTRQAFPPNPAQNPSPANGASFHMSSPVPFMQNLSWSPPSSGLPPTGYKLSWNGGPLVELGNVLNVSVLIPGPSSYTWQIVPYNAEGNTVGCPTWSFNVFPYPPDFYDVSVSSMPSGAVIYVNGTNSGFVTPHTFAMLETTSAVFSVQMAGYTWTPPSYVVNNILANTSIYFIGTLSISPPVLIVPLNNSLTSQSEIYFDWSGVGADYYQLLVDDDSDFSSPEVNTLRYPKLTTEEKQRSYYNLCGNWLSAGIHYWKVVAYYSGEVTYISEVWSFTYNPPLSDLAWLPIYRSYKQRTSDHFYCTYDTHLAIAQADTFRYEKVEGFLSNTPYTPPEGRILKAVYRFASSGGPAVNEQTHFYTTSETEREEKIVANWYYEGITGYTDDAPEFVPLYHLYKHGQNPIINNDHFYTTSEFERDNAIANFGYDANYDIMCYVSLDGNVSTLPWSDNQAAAGQGINPANGNFSSYAKDVFSIPGGKMSLDFSFSYNSYNTFFLSKLNPLGYGWNHNYNSYIYARGTRLYVYWSDGSINIYNNAEPYTVITPGVYDRLEFDGINTYTITKKNQVVFTFQVRLPDTGVAVLTEIRDRNANLLTLSYQTASNLLDHVSDRFNRMLSFTYATDDTVHYTIQSVTDQAGGRSVHFGYDEYHNLISFRDAMNKITAYVYDPAFSYEHMLIRINYPNGHYIFNDYDANRRMQSQSISNPGVNLNLVYNNNITTVTDQFNVESTYEYDDDTKKNLEHLVSPAVVAYYDYNDVNNPTLPTSVTDGNNNITNITYDTRGNITDVYKPGGVVHHYEYNALNDLTEYEDPLHHHIYYGYNDGNLTSVQTPRGTTNLQYGTYGKVTSVTSPVGQTTSYGYDGFDNILSISRPLGLNTNYTYDNVSRVTAVSNPASQVTSYQYYANDKISSVTELGDITSYGYDDNGNLTSISKNGQTTSLDYNNLDLLESVTNPLSETSYMSYYPNGMLQSVNKPNGNIISYTYNVSYGGTLSSVSGPGVNLGYTYDPNRNVTGITDNNGTNNLAYDTLNRISTVTSNYGAQSIVSYTYDDAGNIASMSYGVHTVEYDYDADNLLHSVTDWNNRTTTFSYRNDGSLNAITYPNGIINSYGYDDAGRLTSLSNHGVTNVNSYSYTLNLLGFHTEVEQTEPLNSFPLAELNQNCTYDNANRIQTAGNCTFTHNANGDMMGRSSPTTSYSWDGLDRLTGISGSSNISYTYDAMDNRRSRTENGITVRYVLDINASMTNVLMETDISGNPLNYYIYANGILISRVKPDGSTRYYHYDSRGSTIAMTNETGTMTHKYSYTPYGKVINLQEEDPNPFRYVGGFGVMDEGNGLSYMRARYYDQNLGRFISEDFIWDSNLFSYGRNNQINMLDYTGMTYSVAGIFEDVIKESRAHIRGPKPKVYNRALAYVKVAEYFMFAMDAFDSYGSINAEIIANPNMDNMQFAEILSSEITALAYNGVVGGLTEILRASLWVSENVMSTKENRQAQKNFNNKIRKVIDHPLFNASGADVRKLSRRMLGL